MIIYIDRFEVTECKRENNMQSTREKLSDPERINFYRLALFLYQHIQSILVLIIENYLETIEDNDNLEDILNSRRHDYFHMRGDFNSCCECKEYKKNRQLTLSKYTWMSLYSCELIADHQMERNNRQCLKQATVCPKIHKPKRNLLNSMNISTMFQVFDLLEICETFKKIKETISELRHLKGELFNNHIAKVENKKFEEIWSKLEDNNRYLVDFLETENIVVDKNKLSEMKDPSEMKYISEIYNTNWNEKICKSYIRNDVDFKMVNMQRRFVEPT